MERNYKIAVTNCFKCDTHIAIIGVIYDELYWMCPICGMFIESYEHLNMDLVTTKEYNQLLLKSNNQDIVEVDIYDVQEWAK